MSAPAHGSKRSGSVRKATALGAPHTKKKRRLNGPDKKRGRGGVGDTQSQAPIATRRSQGQQEQPTRGRGGQKARRAMTAAFEEVTGGEQGRGMSSKVDDTEFGQQTQLQYDALDLFDYGDAPPLSPSPTTALQASASLQHSIEDDVSDGGNATGVLCPESVATVGGASDAVCCCCWRWWWTWWWSSYLKNYKY